MVILVVLSSSIWSLELVQATEASPSQSTTVEEAVTLKTDSDKVLIRRIGIDLENLLSRGDIRGTYEWLDSKQKWNYVFSGHVNPHPDHKLETGTVGLLGGGRLYINERNIGLFTEVKAGINIESSEAVFATEVTAGYVKEWKNDIFYEVGLGFNRSYGSVNDELKVTLMLNLMIGYPYKILGF